MPRTPSFRPEAEKASEAASRIEKNSDADPTAPVTTTSPKAGGTPPMLIRQPPKPASTDNQPAKNGPLIKTSLLVRRRKPLSLRLKVSTSDAARGSECHGNRGAFGSLRPSFGHRAVTGPEFRSVDASLAGVRIWPERKCSINVTLPLPVPGSGEGWPGAAAWCIAAVNNLEILLIGPNPWPPCFSSFI